MLFTNCIKWAGKRRHTRLLKMETSIPDVKAVSLDSGNDEQPLLVVTQTNNLGSAITREGMLCGLSAWISRARIRRAHMELGTDWHFLPREAFIVAFQDDLMGQN